jgi:hypothetical protein
MALAPPAARLRGVDLRSPTPDPLPGSSSDETPETGHNRDVTPTGDAAWRVDRRLTVAKLAGAAVFALAAVLGYPDQGQVIVVGLAAVLLAVLGVRDLIAPVRLAVNPEGVIVATGFNSRREIPWTDVAKIRVDARRGLMLRSQVLELDTGDNLYFFSSFDLGAPCEEVAERLKLLSAR